jgi:hypothetical protein
MEDFSAAFSLELELIHLEIALEVKCKKNPTTIPIQMIDDLLEM